MPSLVWWFQWSCTRRTEHASDVIVAAGVLAEATVTVVMSVQTKMIDKSAGMVVEKDVREISVAAGMQGRGQG